MKTYLAFMRGINVGGKTLIPMAELRNILVDAGLEDVRTYIASGNVIFQSKDSDKKNLRRKIESSIEKRFKLQVAVTVFTADEWQQVIKRAPEWWGKDKNWKHNLMILMDTVTSADVMDAIGQLKPNIEKVKPGDGVVYQSMQFIKFGQTTSGKLASNSIYKQMTIRSFNTSNKLAAMLD